MNLDLHTDAITSDELHDHRTSLKPHPWESTHPRCHGHISIADAAERLGIPEQTMGYWEVHGVSFGPSAAMVRMWMTEDVRFEPDATVSGDEVRGLCALVGGTTALADQMGVSAPTVRNWRSGKVGSNAGRLMRCLCDELAGAITETMEAA